MQQMLYDYTKGDYHAICDYSQYINDATQLKYEKEWFEKERLKEISEQQKESAVEIMKIINSQPIKEEMLYRIEGNINNAEAGEILNFGIRSTTRDKDFAEKVFNGSVDGFDYNESHFNGKFTEYRFINSKSLDISGISEYKEQQEELISGKYKVVKTEVIENKKAGYKEETVRAQDVAENVERFISKKSGKEMLRYTYDDHEYTESEDKFLQRTFTKHVYQKGQFGRKVIYLEKV